MNIRSVSVIYFSPTGTTRKIAEHIVTGLGIRTVSYIDITTPAIRADTAVEIKSDCIVIGFPVYAEHMPSFVRDYLENIKYRNQPAVVFSVYGNMDYGLSLREAYDVLAARGLKVTALGTFIAEHSFSTKTVPLADGRPDQTDRAEAENFGVRAAEKITQNMDVRIIDREKIPGKIILLSRILPKNSSKVFTKILVADSQCTKCMACIKTCPVGAISSYLYII